MADLIEGYNTPTPDQVPGYEAAKAAGQIPIVPSEPPQLLPGATVKTQLLRLVAIFFGALIALIILSKALTGLNHGGVYLGNILSGLISLGFLVWFARALLRSRDQTLAEAKAGYGTTKTLWTNGYGKAARATRWQGGRVPWNSNGLWILDNTGKVLTAPEPGLLAPGYYPSPNRPGEFELWTGAVWLGTFKPAP